MSDLKAYLQQAVESNFGIAIKSKGCLQALRRQCYHLRQKERRDKNCTFDYLSFVIKGDELLLVRRDKILPPDTMELKARELDINERPSTINARGSCRLTFCNIL